MPARKVGSSVPTFGADRLTAAQSCGILLWLFEEGQNQVGEWTHERAHPGCVDRSHVALLQSIGG